MKEYRCLSAELSSHIDGISDIEDVFGENFNFHDAEVDEVYFDNYDKEAEIKMWIHCHRDGKNYDVDWHISGFRGLEASGYDAAVHTIGCCYFETSDDCLKIHLDHLGLTIFCESMEIEVSEVSLFSRAREISKEAHKGQVDKAGEDYFLHPFRVMVRCKDKTEQIVALLHDVVEDSDWTFEMLEEEGFTPEIIDALKCLTKLSDDEDYDDFISRVMTNQLAMKIKLYDIEDNLDLSRLGELTEEDINRSQKYMRARARLKDALNES